MLTRVTSEGRIGIPAKLRKEIGIVDGDLMDATIENGRVILERMEPRCKICEGKDPVNVSGVLICEHCIAKLKSALEANTTKGE